MIDTSAGNPNAVSIGNFAAIFAAILAPNWEVLRTAADTAPNTPTSSGVRAMADLSSVQFSAILEGLRQGEIRELESIARVEHAAIGERLFRHGDTADTFYLVKDGSFTLTIQVRALDDHVEIPIEKKVAGDALGWSSLVEPHRSIYSAYCTRGGSVFAFARRDLEEMMVSDPNLGHRFSRNLNHLIGSRIRALQQLWIEEVERSMKRVDHWSNTELGDELDKAIASTHKREHWWRHAST